MCICVMTLCRGRQGERQTVQHIPHTAGLYSILGARYMYLQVHVRTYTCTYSTYWYKVCTYICIYSVHTYIHIHTYICIRTVQTCTYNAYMYILYTHTHTCTYIKTYCTYMYVHIHTYLHNYTNMNVHIHTTYYTHTHTVYTWT